MQVVNGDSEDGSVVKSRWICYTFKKVEVHAENSTF